MADGDFPAAHSMDVGWFAVDKCGHVASFDSGDEGAVPFKAPESDILWTSRPFRTELKRSLQEDKIRLGRHASKLSSSTYLRGGSADQEPIRIKCEYGLGFFLLGPGALSERGMIRPPTPEQPLGTPETGPAFGSTDGYEWADGSMHPESWHWLHASPDRCLGCEPLLHFFDHRAELLRIFRYDTDGYDGPPYEWRFAPEKPATLEELQSWFPEPLPVPLEFSQFCFRDKPLIQPLQYYESARWDFESTWVHEDGRRLRYDGTPAEWLAVDRCNHVAWFEAGKDGAVPEGAPHAESVVASWIRPAAGELDRCLQEGGIVPGVHRSKFPDPMFNRVHGFYLLGPGVKDQMGPGSGALYRWAGRPTVGTADGHDWAQGYFDVDSWTRLHEVPHRCLGCLTHLHFDPYKRAERLGITRYECSQSGAVPYERTAYPPVPATLEEVSKAMGRPLEDAPRFSGFCFLDKPRLQPLQWLPCAPREGREEFTDEEGRPRRIRKPEP